MKRPLLALTIGLSVLFFANSQQGQANTPESIYQADYTAGAGTKCESGTVYSWGEIKSIVLQRLSVPITTEPTVQYGIATESKGCFPQMSQPRSGISQKYLNGRRFDLPRQFTPKLQVKISLANEKTIARLRTQSGVMARVTGTLGECSPIQQ